MCGKDLTVILGKMSSDLNLLNDMNFKKLDQKEIETMKEWINYFDIKAYPRVGHINYPKIN